MATRLQAEGNVASGASSVSKAFTSNVQAGSLIVVMGAAICPSIDTWAAGDCTKTAGTATLVSPGFQLDQQLTASTGGGYYGEEAIWSAVVDAGGSLTLQLAGLPASSYVIIGIAEFSPTSGYVWDSSRYETQNEASGSSGTSFSSGNATSAGAAVFAGSLQTNSGSDSAITEDANWQLVYEAETGVTSISAATCTRIAGSGLTDDASWTGPTSFGWQAGVAVFKETSTGSDYGTPYDHEGVAPWSSIWRPARF